MYFIFNYFIMRIDFYFNIEIKYMNQDNNKVGVFKRRK
jgi:hypothetical protein